ncbi:FadR/GntR family transcriptional regulator [Lentzea sp. JNUCC 0626]|uniref:FadR/GntR family transcriptional regulator n=1 Tax=Lentzea sp. JNUCC 0626 TaxID=3367513 RepID=UPI00374A3505
MTSELVTRLRVLLGETGNAGLFDLHSLFDSLQRDPSKIREALQAWRVVEPAATAFAAGRITKLGLRRLDRLCGAYEAAKLPEARARLDHDFHRCVVEFADNRFLARTHAEAGESLRGLRLFRSVWKPHGENAVADDHREIVAALVRRDEELASARALAHVAVAERWLSDAQDWLAGQG